jgi:hypothetical protein
MNPLNWSEAAGILGKSRQAVRDLVNRGVLTDCVVRDRDGKPIGITNADDLRAECNAKVRPRAGGGGQEAEIAAKRAAKRDSKPRSLRPVSIRTAPKPAAAERPPRTNPDEVPDYNESRAKTEYEKSLLLEIERRQKEGQLVERESVVSTWAQLINSAKTKLLAVPTTVRQRIPHLTAEEGEVIDVVIRAALADLTEDAGCPEQVRA